MKKNLLGKIAIVVILLVAFIGYTVYTHWKNSHFTVDPNAFDIKDSMQAVMADEYHDFNNMTNLKLAAHYHLLQNVNQTAEVPKLHRQIEIHKIWALPNQFYVLYSINLKKSDKFLYDVPELKFSTVQFHSKSGKTLKAKVKDKFTEVSSGKVYHHRLYRGIIVRPDYNSFQSKMTLFEKVMNSLDKISLGQPTLIWNGTKSGHPKVPVDGLRISGDYNKSNDTYFTMPLHQHLTLGNGQTLTFKRLKAKVQRNLIYFSVKPGHEQIKDMFLKISGPRPHDTLSFLVNHRNGQTFMNVPGFTDIPKQLKIQIKGITSITNKSIHFQIPGWDGKENSQNVNKKVAKMLGAPLYFEGYTNHFKGPQQLGKIAVKMKIKFPKSKNNLFNASIYNLVPLNQVEKGLKQVKDKKIRKKMKAGISGLVTFKNDDGKSPDFAQLIGTTGTNQSTTYTLLLNKSYVKNTDHLQITVHHLTKFTKINDKKLVIKLPNKVTKGK